MDSCLIDGSGGRGAGGQGRLRRLDGTSVSLGFLWKGLVRCLTLEEGGTVWIQA